MKKILWRSTINKGLQFYKGLQYLIKIYDSVKASHLKIFKASLEEPVFSEKHKILKVMPVFQKGEKENVENYRPIFSKALERIMYNRLHGYFMNNNFL